jgi:NAD-dependent dihydropyrimidine dehydrogenase PreA subunit
VKQKEVYISPNLVTPNKPIQFNEEACIGCNQCVEVCPMDVLLPNPEKGKPPIVMYPDECWYEGLCVKNCPRRDEGAIIYNHPINQRVRWKRKATGEHFRIGMPNPPPPVNRPPVGGWNAKA